MGQERLPPDAILAMTNLSGVVGEIQDDPDSPDTDWLDASSNNVNTDVRTSFGTPASSPKVGADLQEFRVLCRQFDEGQGGAPDGRIELWENGGLLRAGPDTEIPDGGIVLSLTWNANELGTGDGSLVECKAVGTKSGGSPSNRNSTEFGAIEWNEEYSTGTVHEGAGQSDGLSTAAAAGNVEHTGAAQSDGVSTATATGTVGTTHEGAGQSDGLSTASGAGNVEHVGAAQSDGTSTAVADGNVDHTGAGQADGVATATGTGTIGTTHEGATQSDGTSTAAGSASADFAGAGLSQGTSTATGTGTISDFYDVVCTMGIEEVHRFEDHTENNAIGVANAMVDFSPSLEWTHPEPTVWLGNGDRKIELVGAE